MSLYEVLSLLLEFAVLIILVMEYMFDRTQVMKQANKIKYRVKVKNEFETLNTGEGK